MTSSFEKVGQIDSSGSAERAIDQDQEKSQLKRLHEMCEEFKGNSSIGYTLKVSEDKKVILLLITENTSETKTNEDRSGVKNKLYADFMANTLKVKKIIELNKMNDQIQGVTMKYSDHEVYYYVGQYTKKFYYDTNVVPGGYRYFKSVTRAYYHRDVPENYSGKWLTWSPDGTLKSEHEYSNGQLIKS